MVALFLCHNSLFPSTSYHSFHSTHTTHTTQHPFSTLSTTTLSTTTPRTHAHPPTHSQLVLFHFNHYFHPASDQTKPSSDTIMSTFATTLQNDADFQAEKETPTVQKASASMRDDTGSWKLVTDSAGIGKALGPKFEAAGYHKLYNLVGQFLSLDMDKEDFLEFLQETGGTSMNTKNRTRCWACVAKYVDDHM